MGTGSVGDLRKMRGLKGLHNLRGMPLKKPARDFAVCRRVAGYHMVTVKCDIKQRGPLILNLVECDTAPITMTALIHLTCHPRITLDNHQLLLAKGH